MPVGAHLVETELAIELGVSRTPIRAALAILLDQGQVESRPNAGYFVRRVAEVSQLAQQRTTDTLSGLFDQIMRDRAAGNLHGDITEAAIAEFYGVSRTLSNKVLVRLAEDGLAQKNPGSGWSFTSGLDSSDARRESYQFRMILECAGLREPVFVMPKDLAASLRKQHQEALENISNISGQAFFELNCRFHEALAQCSQNRFIFDAVQKQNRLRQISEYADFQTLEDAEILRSCREHLRILSAAVAGKHERAAQLMHAHLVAGMKYV